MRRPITDGVNYRLYQEFDLNLEISESIKLSVEYLDYAIEQINNERDSSSRV